MTTKELIEWLVSKDVMENCVETKIYGEIIKRLEELDDLKLRLQDIKFPVLGEIK